MSDTGLLVPHVAYVPVLPTSCGRVVTSFLLLRPSLSARPVKPVVLRLSTVLASVGSDHDGREPMHNVVAKMASRRGYRPVPPGKRQPVVASLFFCRSPLSSCTDRPDRLTDAPASFVATALVDSNVAAACPCLA